MKLYKYKPLSNFEFIVDILLNKRLYAAHFRELNDPMEGDYSTHKTKKKYQKKVDKEINKLRVCSLSKSMNNSIMWAHYADGFKGICIELEIDNSILNPIAVTYSPFNPIVSENYRDLFGDGEVLSPKDWAMSALKGKYEEWEYEDEYRIFSQNKYITTGFKITKIYLGTRIDDLHKDLIYKLLPKDVKIIETTISNVNNVVSKTNKD